MAIPRFYRTARISQEIATPVCALARNDSDSKGGSAMQKKIPQRQCMGCRERKAKRELIRVVRSPEGEVSLDFGGKKNGRGAYICPNMECLKKAIRSKALDRSLEVTIPQEVYQRLEKEMEDGHE